MNNNFIKPIETNTVSIISDFILDSYASGFSILQELVQNACDANATHLMVKFLENGLHNGIHPLLSNPLLFIMNDGPFSDENNHAIGRLGAGSKGASDLSIGKFGLGLKSLFHWCDMFFYFTTDEKYRSAINPFSEYDGKDLIHPGWNYASVEDAQGDFELLRKSACSVVKDARKVYFCIAVPLRLNDGGEHIRQNYFSSMSLRNLFALREKNGAVENQDFCSALQVMLATLYVSVSAKKKCLLSQLSFYSNNEEIHCELDGPKGTVRCSDNGKPMDSQFVSLPGIPDTKGVADIIKQSSSWPKNKVATVGKADQTVNQRMNENDCSLVFMKTKEPGKQFRISWASFLPLKDSKEELRTVANRDSEYSYQIIFNGSFGIDSGRNHIIGYKKMFLDPYAVSGSVDEVSKAVEEFDNQEELIAFWNAFLFQRIISLRLPELLLLAFQKLEIGDDFKYILKCFEYSGFRAIRDFSTREQLLGYTLVGKRKTWKLMHSDLPVLIVPFPRPALIDDPLFMQFLKAISSDGTDQILLCENSSSLTQSFYDTKNIKDIWLLDESRLNAALSLLIKFEYSPLLSNKSFIQFLAGFISQVHFGQKNGADCISFVKNSLLQYYLQQEKISDIPLDFVSSFLVELQKRLSECRFEAFFIPCKLPEPYFFETWSWDGNFILLPKDRCQFDSSLSQIKDIDSYLNNLQTIISAHTHDSEMGQLFDACVLNFLPANMVEANLKQWMKSFFPGLSVIPVNEFSVDSPNGLKVVYKSYVDAAHCKSFPAVDQILPIASCFDFAPELEPQFAIRNDIRRKFDIDQNANPLSLETLVFECLAQYSGPRISENAEPLIKFLLKSRSWDVISARLLRERVEIFPTTDNRVTAVGFPDVYIDIEGFLPDFHALNKEHALVRASQEELANLYKGCCLGSKILQESQVLKVYLSNVEDYEINQEIVLKYLQFFSASSNDDPVLRRLKRKKWFTYKGRKYAGMEIFDKGINSKIHSYFEDVCLFVEKEDLDEGVFELLRKKRLMVTSVDEISDEVFKPIFKNAFSLNIAENEQEKLNPKVLLSALASLPESNVMRGWGIFVSARMDENDKMNFRSLNCLVSNEDEELIRRTCLALLSQISGFSASSEKRSTFAYVCKFACSHKIKFKANEIKEIKFPSQADSWEFLDSLCDYKRYFGIDKRCLLFKDIPLACFDEQAKDQKQQEEENFNFQLPTLQEIQTIWPRVNPNLIAMMFYISRRSKYRQFACNQLGSESTCLQYLRNYTPYSLISREYIGLSVERVFSLDSTTTRIPTVSFSLDSNGTLIKLGGKTREVQSLLGSVFAVAISGEAIEESAYFKYETRVWDSCYYLRPLLDASVADSNRCVCKLINDILFERFKQTHHDFQEDMNHLLDNEQAEMQASQMTITDSIDYTLRSLNVQKDSPAGKKLAVMLNQISELGLEANRISAISKDMNKVVFNKKKSDEVKIQIVDSIAHTCDMRDLVLNAVRKKLDAAQYGAWKVPFEIFQNADDAILQRTQYDDEFKQKNDFYYKIEKSNDSLLIEHNGRPINFSPSQDSHKEWRRDLINMLSFGMSTKQQNGNSKNAETGKFGLGFKSCYALTDNPKIVSSMLFSAEILGGVYPVYAPFPDGNWNGRTLFQLPLSPEGLGCINDVLEKFNTQIPGLLLFAKKINSISFDNVKISKKIIQHHDNIFFVSISSTIFVQLELPQGSVAFAFKDGEFLKCDAKLSRLWMVTPLGNPDDGARYLIDSPFFAVDIGRDQFALNRDENMEIADSIGSGIGDFLVQLLSSEDEFEGLFPNREKNCAQILDIIADKLGNDFYLTIFQSAYRKVFHKHIYTGYGEFYLRTANEDSFLILSNDFYGCKESEAVRACNVFMQKKGKADSLILISRKVFVPGCEDDCKPVDSIQKFLEVVLDSRDISVSLYAEIIELCGILEIDEEEFPFYDYQYLSCAGKYNALENLVSNQSWFYSIAPSEYRLQEGYQFQFDSVIPEELIIEWIDECPENKKLEVLNHLGFDSTLCLTLRRGYPDSWPVCSYDDYEDQLDPETYDQLTRYLSKCFVSQNSFYSNQIQSENSSEYIDYVYAKWKALDQVTQNKKVREYRRKTFGVMEFDFSERGKSKDWLRLLYITGLLGLGRVTTAANITFVNNFLARGIWTKDPLAYPKEWIQEIVMKPMNYRNDYEEWRKFFPYFAQISNCANDLFNFFTEAVGPYERRLDFSHSEESNGTDFDLPNLSHSLAKFYPIILRELHCSKQGMFFDQAIKESQVMESFYPSRPIREKLGEMDSSEFFNLVRKNNWDAAKAFLDYPFHIFETEGRPEINEYEAFPEDELNNMDDYRS